MLPTNSAAMLPVSADYAPPVAAGPSRLEEFYQGIKQIIVRADREDYNGTTFGVRFTDGLAVINHRMTNRWNYSLAELAVKFQIDLPGYTVEADEWHPGQAPWERGLAEPPPADPDEKRVGPPPLTAGGRQAEAGPGPRKGAGLKAKVEE